MELTLRYGRTTQSVTLARDRLVAEVALPAARPVEDVAGALRAALACPAGPRLEEAVHRGERVLVITVDHTRPSPAAVLWPLVERLETLGATVELMVALGNHRPMTEEEAAGFYGVGGEGGKAAGPGGTGSLPASAAGQAPAGGLALRPTGIPIHQNASRDPDQWRLGVTRHGTPIEVSPVLREFDKRLVLGFVEPHYIAGFSGGRKMILPGCASRSATTRNHFLTMLYGPQLGRLEGNPVHEDMLDAARTVGVHFACNIVVNPDDSFHKVHCGDVFAAHEMAVRDAEAIYRASVPGRADIVICSPGGWPYDVDMVQAKKALVPALSCVKPGGAIILVAECERSWGATQPNWDLLHPETALRTRRQIEQQLRHGSVEHDWAACSPGVLFSRVVHDAGATLIAVSRLGDALKETYLLAADSLEEALESAERKVGRAASVIALHDARRLMV